MSQLIINVLVFYSSLESLFICVHFCVHVPLCMYVKQRMIYRHGNRLGIMEELCPLLTSESNRKTLDCKRLAVFHSN